MTSQLTDRNREILRLFDAGEKLEYIGAIYGITRERVRQIVGKFGAKPRRQAQWQKDAEIIEVLRSEHLSSNAAQARFGHRVLRLARDNGIVLQHEWLWRAPEIAQLAERVKAGESIRSACGANRNLEALVGHYCQANGITSRHGRWNDKSDRAEIVARAREAGKTWAQIALAVSRAEGRAIGKQAIINWACGHMDRIPPRGRSAMTMRPARKILRSREKPRVTYNPNIKKAAELNYGKAPASVIAAVHGVTRNVIIGHWFRLRKAGVLA